MINEDMINNLNINIRELLDSDEFDIIIPVEIASITDDMLIHKAVKNTNKILKNFVVNGEDLLLINDDNEVKLRVLKESFSMSELEAVLKYLIANIELLESLIVFNDTKKGDLLI